MLFLRQNKTLKKEKIKDGMSISFYVNMEREKLLKNFKILDGHIMFQMKKLKILYVQIMF